jgi:PAS domain S-box-containing protein
MTHERAGWSSALAAEGPAELSEPLRLLDLAYDAIFVIDLQTHEIKYWNRGAERMYGYSRPEALGRVSHELLRTQHVDATTDVYDSVRRLGHWEGRLTQTRQEGSQVLVDAKWDLDEQAGRILEINRDVTTQVDEQERFEILVSSVRDYAIFMLDPSGNVVTWNEGGRRTKGYEAEEIIGQHFSVFYTPEDIAAGKPGFYLNQAQELGRFEGEGWRVRRDKSRFWANVVITALHSPSGRLTGYAKVTRDVTERFLERKQLEELEKSKSTFLRLAAHELRAPLSVISGYVSLLAGESKLDQRTVDQKVVPTLSEKTAEMRRLVDQMLEAARLEDGSLALRLEQVDLGDLVRKSVALTQNGADKAHSIEASPVMDELVVRVDPERIAMILNNLLSNAIKYSPKGGTVIMSARRDGARATVSVADQGVGIGEDQRDLLFGRFVRLRSAGASHVGGTGLGLYLSRELARMHGGDLVLEQSGPEGSRFALWLPLA